MKNKLLKKVIAILLIIILMVILLGISILMFCAYKGSPPGYLNYPQKYEVNVNDVILNARKLKGVFYDQLQGSFNNLGGKLGFLVCCDIPNIAYAQAGMSFEKLLKDDFKSHPEHYRTRNGTNTPSTIFFYRRVENFYAYCKYSNKLIINCESPKVGDLIFYGQSHVTIVSEVHSDGTINEIETNRRTIFVVEHFNKKWTNQSVGRVLN
jgi:uncharacterized protein YijF (DUF1287 family)